MSTINVLLITIMGKELGTLFGPAGVGKDTLLNELTTRDGYGRIVNTTTRLPRPGERHGKDYYFIDEVEHHQLVTQNAYLTNTHANGRYYGVQNSEVSNAWSAHKMPVGHFGVNDHVNLWNLDDAHNMQVSSALLLTPDFKTWEERMSQRLQTNFITTVELFNRAREAVREVQFAQNNIGRFAVILTVDGTQSVDEVDQFYKHGEKPAIHDDFLNDMLGDFDTYLGLHGEH